MSIVSVQELLESGVHFGHRTSRWNPKMAPFIFGKRNLIHIIDIRQTVRGLVRAYRFLERLTAAGGQVIFVGTKRQSRIIIAEEATRARMPYVSERWLGGTLTNHATIRSRVKRLAELETIAGDNPSPDLSKKELSSLRRKLRKMEKNLSGIRNLNGIPGALVIVDSRREFNAVREARRTHVPVIALVDTDCNPEEIDIPIPCNDDSARTIRLLLRKLADAVVAGQSQFAVSPPVGGRGDRHGGESGEPTPMITADAVKALREKTGLGMMECKMALTETGGDAVKAVDYLRKKGHDTAQKKAGRATKEGRIASYIHNGKIGVMVEIQCETDFVAKNDVFQQLLKDVAMHVVACSPLAVARAEIPAALVEKEKEIYRAQVDGKKPAPIIEKIVEGKLGKFYAEKCLLEQPFAKDPTRKVEDVLKEVIQKTGENIQIRRFVRLELGGE